MLVISCALDILHIYKLLAHYGISLLSSPSVCPPTSFVLPQTAKCRYLRSTLLLSFPRVLCLFKLFLQFLHVLSATSRPCPISFRVLVHVSFTQQLDNLIILFLLSSSSTHCTSITYHFATILHLFTPTYTHIWIHRRNPLRARVPPFFIHPPRPPSTSHLIPYSHFLGYRHWIAPLAERFRLFLVIHAMCNVVILILLCLFCPQFGKPAFFVLRLPVHYDHPSMGPPNVAVCEHTLDSPCSRPV